MSGNISWEWLPDLTAFISAQAVGWGGFHNALDSQRLSFGLRWIEQRWADGGCSIDVTDDRIAQPHRRPEAKKMDSPLHPVSRYVWAKLFFSVRELPTRIFSLLWASDQPVCPPFFSLAIYDTKGQRRLLRVDSRGMKVSASLHPCRVGWAGEIGVRYCVSCGRWLNRLLRRARSWRASWLYTVNCKIESTIS
jgi:hypothetical protein